MYKHPVGTIIYTIEPNDSLWLLAQRYNTTINAIIAANPKLDINYLRIGQPIYICPDNKKSYSLNNSTTERMNNATSSLRNQFHILWEQHVAWTRFTILSMVLNLPDLSFVTHRLLRNPKDFELALIPFYGTKSAAKFSNLLKNHIVIAVQLVKASIIGDTRSATAIEKSWYNNANEISMFLASINPYWSTDNWKKMFYNHLAMTKNEAVYMLTRNYSAGINEYDAIEKQALKMADVMADGILKQFPSINKPT